MFEGEIIYSSESNTKYTVIKTFKGGGQAEVSLAISDKTEDVYFIKRLLCIKYTLKTKEIGEKFFAERKKIYQAINSNTIPNGSCCYVHDFFRCNSFYYVVYERITANNLSLSDLTLELSFDQKLLLLKILTYSLRAFEIHNIVHSDLKPDNILYKIVNDHLVVKLIDFESSFFSDNPPEKGCIIGTDPYYSPELSLYNKENNEIDRSILSFKSDIFSLGVIFLEFLTGHYPYNRLDESYVYENVLKNREIEPLKHLTEPLKGIIKQMLDKNPQNRPAIIKILAALDSVDCKLFDTRNTTHKPYIFTEFNHGFAKIYLFSLVGNDIYYSLRGDYSKYTAPIIVKENTSIKYYMVFDKHKTKVYESEIILFDVYGKVSKPKISIHDRIVRISCETSGANIYYTLDGSIPTKDSTLYTHEFTLDFDCRINAIAFSKHKKDSEIATLHTLSKIRVS